MVDDDVGDDLEVNVKTYSNNASGLPRPRQIRRNPGSNRRRKGITVGKMMLNIMGCFSMIEKRLAEQRQNQALGTEPDCNDFPEDYCDIEPVPLSPRKRPLSATWDYDFIHAHDAHVSSLRHAVRARYASNATSTSDTGRSTSPAATDLASCRKIHGSHPIPYQRQPMLHHQQQQPGLYS
jgi:hypothetical protein